MDTDAGNLAAYLALFVLLLLSFFFSLTETAFTALNRIRIKNMADKGSKNAKLALALYEDFDRLLSSLLVGTTVANLTIASICTVLFVNAFGDIGATVSTVVLAVVVVVFAEVTPKTIARESPERIALFCAPIAKFFMVLFTPINAFFAWWKKGLVRIFKTPEDDRTITEDELLSFVEEARCNGVIDDGDKELIHNVIEFYDQKAEDILVPRIDVASISKDAATDEISELFFDTGLSRIPVYDGSIDNIIGILHTRNFLRYVMKDGVALESILCPAVFVPAQMDIGDLLKLLQKEKSQMAIVIDDHGGTDGIVTMEDILEELVGEIWDESDKVIEPIIPFGENSYKVICSSDTHGFFEHFSLPKDDNHDLPPTICGWILDVLGKIPEKDDSFKYENLTVTVSQTERRRALECIVTVEDTKESA